MNEKKVGERKVFTFHFSSLNEKKISSPVVRIFELPSNNDVTSSLVFGAPSIVDKSVLFLTQAGTANKKYKVTVQVSVSPSDEILIGESEFTVKA
jgi:hypothetical protein